MELVFLIETLLLAWAVYGIVCSIKNRRWISLVVSLIGCIGVAVVFCLMFSYYFAEFPSFSSGDGDFCGTAHMNRWIDFTKSTFVKYAPSSIIALIVAGTGGWTHLFSKIQKSKEKSSGQTPEITFEIPDRDD